MKSYRYFQVSPTHRLRDSWPSGSQNLGQTFALAPHQFADEHAQVMWALSFMKGGQAAHFVGHLMRNYQLSGRLPYTSYSDFSDEFTSEFCLKNKIQSSQTELETVKYFQGT
jgi:hypothetical protein